MDLSIIIVNWNSRDFVRSSLGSIFENTKDIEFEVIVVDSGSFDGCAEMVGTEFPDVRFVQSKENVGFAMANNIGFDFATGRNVLFLNPDTRVVGPALSRMCKAVDEMENPGVVGCRLLNGDGSLQDSCVMSFPTILNQLLNANWLRKCFPQSKLWGNACLFSNREFPCEVEAISGACLMMRRQTCEEVGRFTLGYFMYSEDLDLGYKCFRKGYKNAYVPVAEVIHYGDGSVNSAKSNFAVVMAADAIRRFFERYRGAFYATVYRVAMSCAAAGRLVMLGIRRVVRRSGNGDAEVRWWSIFRWSMGMEAWVLKYK